MNKRDIGFNRIGMSQETQIFEMQEALRKNKERKSNLGHMIRKSEDNIPSGFKIEQSKTPAGGIVFDILDHDEHIGIAFNYEMGVKIARALSYSDKLESLIKEMKKDIKNNERFESTSYPEMLRNADRRGYLKKLQSIQSGKDND